MTRPTYVYRLKVQYPEGVDWRNPPTGWEPEEVYGPEGPDVQKFRWPPERAFLSKEAAAHRAKRLRDWGCTVIIERSEPVTWAT